MKRKGNLFEKISSRDNIERAILNASRRKRKRHDVAPVVANISRHVDVIEEILLSGTYKSSKYARKTVIDGSSGKTRDIMKPKFFPDQCIQWAVMQVVEPILSRGTYHYSCGSVKGKGSHFAKRATEKWIRSDFRGTKYTLQLDISKFYPSVNHEVLKGLFRKRIKCRKTLEIMDEIVNGGDEGLPIGNYTSQLFANYYMEDIDHHIKQKLGAKYYIRYMDDMVLFGPNKRELHKVFKEVKRLAESRGLKIKGNYQLFKTSSRPLDFLGYRFYRNRTTLRRRNFLRITRRIRKISKKNTLCFKDACAVVSYMGWLKHSDSAHMYEKYIRPYVSIGKAKEVVSNESKRRCKT